MARFKRRRPKNRRAGCLLCHPHKMNGAPPADIFRVGELRRIGGRGRRVSRRYRPGDDD